MISTFSSCKTRNMSAAHFLEKLLLLMADISFNKDRCCLDVTTGSASFALSASADNPSVKRWNSVSGSVSMVLILEFYSQLSYIQ